MSLFTKENPFIAKMTENYVLNKPGSSKDTRHFVFDLEDSGITYLPGDSLYVYPVNDPVLVEELLALLELSNSKEEEFERFSKSVNITRPSNKLFKLLLDKLTTENDFDLKTIESFHEKFNGYNTQALLAQFANLKITTDELADNSSMLLARAYSIASSLSVHEKQVDICVAVVDEEINGQKVFGVCSNYMAHRLPLNAHEARIYIHKNDRFRLPADTSKDIIMVGPGTGIAPFRSFIEERVFVEKTGGSGKSGRNWLFFGDRNSKHDFIYEDELSQYVNDGYLKLSTAFSRDQEEKIYVQDRMKEHADEIYKWIKNGAYFYVCGDARRMARDVDTALREILEANGENADEYIKDLKATGRYSRDVY